METTFPFLRIGAYLTHLRFWRVFKMYTLHYFIRGVSRKVTFNKIYPSFWTFSKRHAENRIHDDTGHPIPLGRPKKTDKGQLHRSGTLFEYVSNKQRALAPNLSKCPAVRWAGEGIRRWIFIQSVRSRGGHGDEHDDKQRPARTAAS